MIAYRYTELTSVPIARISEVVLDIDDIITCTVHGSALLCKSSLVGKVCIRA